MRRSPRLAQRRPLGAGLHDDHPERVPDDIVELTRHPQALLGDRGLSELAAVALGRHGAFLAHRGAQLPATLRPSPNHGPSARNANRNT